jgi:hypothetical protein
MQSRRQAAPRWSFEHRIRLGKESAALLYPVASAAGIESRERAGLLRLRPNALIDPRESRARRGHDGRVICISWNSL